MIYKLWVISEIVNILKMIFILINLTHAHTHTRAHAHVCDMWCHIFSSVTLAAMSSRDKNIIFYSFLFKINQIKFIKKSEKFLKYLYKLENSYLSK